MSVFLRHMKFPLVVVFKDPKDNWDKIVKNCLLEEIKKDGFDNFSVIDEKAAKLFLEGWGTKKKKKRSKKRKKNDEKKIVG